MFNSKIFQSIILFLWTIIVFSASLTIIQKAILNIFPNQIQDIGEIIYKTKQKALVAGEYAKLLASPELNNLPVPVLGINSDQLIDTWGASRSGGRTHQGIDIFAPRGTYVVAPTRMIISSVGYEGQSYNKLGGNHVFATASASKRYYFAHLDTIDGLIDEGGLIEKGAILGTVGNTGNALGTPPHLHFGIYTLKGAVNPFPRLVK